MVYIQILLNINILVFIKITKITNTEYKTVLLAVSKYIVSRESKSSTKKFKTQGMWGCAETYLAPC